jgi:8-oxo-dGTP diphosphatase
MPSETRNNSSICVGLAYMIGGKLLCVRRANPPEKGSWCVPVGHVEPGEVPEEALRREVVEETGLSCGQVIYLTQIIYDNGVGFKRKVLLFGTTYVEGIPRAGDDAIEVAYWRPQEVRARPYVRRLVDISITLATKVAQDRPPLG